MPLDVGVGLILGVLLNSLTSFNFGACLTIGVLASLLPDLDFVWKFIRTRAIPNTQHRDGLHYPLLVVPLVGMAGFLIDPAIGLTVALGTLLHFIHDSFGVGFGVKWLFPFKKNSYLFFYQANVGTNKDMPKKKIYSWNDKERQQAIKHYANPHWIRLIYFRFHPFGIFEYSVFVVGVATAVIFHP